MNVTPAPATKPTLATKLAPAGTIRCRSGLYLDLAAPTAAMIEAQDIAGALARICRFGGQLAGWYSVAEHSCHAARLALEWGYGPACQFACLLHDAAEAYCGDVTRPLKSLVPEFRAIESRLELAIEERFCIRFRDHARQIKQIDNSLLIHERDHLFPRDRVEWSGERDATPLDLRLYCWEPREAERRFTYQFNQLRRLAGDSR